MSWIYRQVIRPGLFRRDAESAHNFALKTLARASRSDLAGKCLGAFFSAPALPVELFGLKFPNPVGVAAGLDKHAAAVPIWQPLGFGFCELGGVTWQAQPGNPPPRMFRAAADDAIINRMGFNNSGAEALARKLSEWKKSGRWPGHPVGINLGKSKVTPLAEAAGDYAQSFRALRDLADFFVVNVSSPNTPGLRELQDKSALNDILAALQEAQSAAAPGDRKPVLVKVAPDLSFSALDEILELAVPRAIAGIVATNTTIARPSTANPALQAIYAETGGLSGKPVRARSTEVIRHLFRQTRGQLPIIGVGGIFDADDAWEKITAGASLVQLYTGLVYEGPGIARAIVRGLVRKMAQHGGKDLRTVVGSGNDRP
jgi:dihydroorotate dehydrogenase